MLIDQINSYQRMRVKHLVLLLLMGISYKLDAQQKATDLIVQEAVTIAGGNEHDRSTEETVPFPMFGDECALELVTLGIGNQWGRVSGMNGFGDLEKAQTLEFDRSASFQVVGGMVWFERPAIVGDGTLILKVYLPREIDGRPDRFIGQSDAIKVSDIVVDDSTAMPTMFTFESTAPILLDQSRFILSCDFANLYQTLDTVVMLQTIPECGDGGDSWELLADGEVWLPISSENSWVLNADFAMAAIVDFDDPTSTTDMISRGAITLYPPQPNPATEQIVLKFEQHHDAPVTIRIFNAQGKLMQKKSHAMVPIGLHQEVIEVSNYTTGTYYYQIVSGVHQITSRFIK